MTEPRAARAACRNGGPLPANGLGARALAVAGCFLCAALTGTLLRAPAPLLVWNASPSSPVGLYLIGSRAGLGAGDTAIAWSPPAARGLAARRRYLPANVPLVKTVAAAAGARVCAIGSRIMIDGSQAATRRLSDPSGRRLPWWSGCVRLGEGDLFLLSPHAPNAYDGRYFGITRASEIVGSGRLLWPR